MGKRRRAGRGIRGGVGPLLRAIRVATDHADHAGLASIRDVVSASTPFDRVWEIPALDFAALQSTEGRRWIADLDALVEDVCRHWGLALDSGDLRHGYHSVVVPATRGAEKCVLKLAWPAESIVDEALALRAWDGCGAVRLVQADTDRGLLLLERLDPTRSLAAEPLVEAASEVGGLLRQMSVPAPAGIRPLSEIAAKMGGAIAARRDLLTGERAAWVEIALSVLSDRTGDDGTTLVHGDLHYGNVIAGRRQPWLVIDPKPMAGDPEVWPSLSSCSPAWTSFGTRRRSDNSCR